MKNDFDKLLGIARKPILNEFEEAFFNSRTFSRKIQKNLDF